MLPFQINGQKMKYTEYSSTVDFSYRASIRITWTSGPARKWWGVTRSAARVSTLHRSSSGKTSTIKVRQRFTNERTINVWSFYVLCKKGIEWWALSWDDAIQIWESRLKQEARWHREEGDGLGVLESLRKSKCTQSFFRWSTPIKSWGMVVISH